MAKFEEQIAEEVVAPVILKLLKPYSAMYMAKAINENVNLARMLQQDPKYLAQLQLITKGVPFADEIAKKVKRKKWITWFVNNSLKHNRPDLYSQIVYNPKGSKYIVKEVQKIAKLIFG